jgi:hypothetical protein
MKYVDNMTEAALAAFTAEIAALDAAYADADLEYQPPSDDWEYEMETLRRAALNRGRP